MMDIYTPLKQLTADLNAVGIRATMDGQDLNPPAVYVTPGRIDDFTFCGGEMEAVLYLVVGDTVESRALEGLSNGLTPLLDALEALQLPITGPITPETVLPASGGSPLPALRITTTLTV